MGKDSKDHPLGTRGSTGGPGFAESGARNWVPSAATVLAFLQKERGLLQPGHRFRTIIREDAIDIGAKKAKPLPSDSTSASAAALIEASAPAKAGRESIQ